MKNYNLRVDLTRFFLVALIVLSEIFNGVTQYFIVLVLALLFALSGVGLQQELQKSETPDVVVRDYLVKLVKITLLSLMVVIPVWFYENDFDNLIQFIIDVLVGSVFIAMIVGTVIVYGLSKLRNRNLAWYGVVLLYMIGLGLSSYSSYFFSEMPHMYFSRNGLFFVPIFIMIGFYPVYKKFVAGLLLSLILFGMEISGLVQMNQFAGLTLFVVPLVIFCLPYILDSDKTHSSPILHFLPLALFILYPVIRIFV